MSAEPWHIDTPEGRALAAAEQKDRLVPDSWEAYIEKHVAGKDVVSVADLLQNGLDIDPVQQTPQNVNRATRYLRRLGFGMHIKGGKKVYARVEK